MAIHLRQICLVARNLQAAVEDLERTLGVQRCYVDPEVAAFGLENTLLPIGTQFLEVVSPVRPGVAADRFLQKRGGDGGYMVICQAANPQEQAELRARAEAEGVRVAFEHNRDDWRIMQLHPGDMGAAFLEVDWQSPTDFEGHWRPAGGEGWRALSKQGAARAICAVELQSKDPRALAARWSAVIGTPAEEKNGAWLVRLANAELRFVEDKDHRGDGVRGLVIEMRGGPDAAERACRRGLVNGEASLQTCGVELLFIS